MFCVDNRCTDVYYNLAAEEYLLKRKKGNYFMLWQSEPSVVIGKHQSIEAEVDLDYVRKHKINIARRFSGGGAVFHDKGNINLTFIETTNRPDFTNYPELVIDFLDTMGITAHSDERLGIYIDKRKVSGSAQCIHKNRVMYHCTLLFETNLETLNAALCGIEGLKAFVPGSSNVRAVPSVRSEVTNINEHLYASMNMRRFIYLLFHNFLDDNDDNRIYRFTRKDEMAIERLKWEKYASEEWIFNKSALKIS